jgi:hypothetical protein
MHALLFRNWKNRVKGRDWYDFEWYVRNNIALNFEHLQQRTEQINAIPQNDFSAENFKNRLKERILKTDIDAVKNDVRPFIKNPAEMEIWGTDYFLQLVDMIKCVKNAGLQVEQIFDGIGKGHSIVVCRKINNEK